MKQTAATLNEDLVTLNKRVAWPLGRQYTVDSNVAGAVTQKIYEAFMISLQDPEQVFSKIELDDKTREVLIQNISKRMKEVTLKVC
jgi:Eukaryotic translation initiation factor 2 alpha subunit